MIATENGEQESAQHVRSAVESLSSMDEAVEFGSLSVSAHGRLQHGAAVSDLAFALINKGIHFRCLWRMRPRAMLLVTADLGKLPYSIEASASRFALKRLIEATPAEVKWRFTLTENHDMRLMAAVSPPVPHTLTSVIAGLVALILEIRPFTDLMGKLLSAPVPSRQGPNPAAP